MLLRVLWGNAMADWIERVTGRDGNETERLRKHVAFARNYQAEFGHGAPGHLDWVLIAKLADLLDATTTEPTAS